MAAQWSQLYRESLELILEKLNLADHARFASVCSSWRSVTVENPPINKPIYFALSHDPKHLVRRFITSFVPSWSEAMFIGASDGWLVILIDRKDLFLLNKGLNSMIPLPTPPDPIPCYFIDSPELCKAVLSSPPSSSSSSSSSVECTVGFKHWIGGVFYCRLGSDKSFTKLSNIAICIEDILFYKGRLYVLCYPNTVTLFDHLLNKVSKLVITHSIRSPNLLRLLISGNDTMYVVAGRPCLYTVFTFEGSEPRMVQVDNIDDKLMLSNRYCTLSITSKEYKEFRRPDFFENNVCTFVVDTTKDPNMAKVDDPWPLFSVMFSCNGIKN